MSALLRWLDRNFLELGRELRWSYLPPLMVYLAAGISSLTNVVGAFFIKDFLDLSAAFIAGLGFWATLPWALKMPVGHLVDLIWRYKSVLVYLGAGLIAVSLLIMIGLLAERQTMASVMSVSAWYVLSVILAPVGYVIQDVVADAMTVEAVPRSDDQGAALPADQVRLMHTTMQTLGRVAIIGGGTLVALVNLYLFDGIDRLGEQEVIGVYILIYKLALLIPVISILGVLLAGLMLRHRAGRLIAAGMDRHQAWREVRGHGGHTRVNWWILGGSAVYVLFSVGMGLLAVPLNQEIVFIGSMAIVVFLISRLMRELEPAARRLLIGTAIIIFVFRAVPGPGPGASWWMMDVLGFDQQFMTLLGLIGSSLALLGIFLFRRYMAEKSIAHIIVVLTIATTILSLPILGMYYGLHQWTMAMTGGVVDARFIAVVDTALESPLGQVAMIPMLAWIAGSAPDHLKATFFAVMASFTNLALAAGQLGSKYLNQVFTIVREVTDRGTGEIPVPADYSELGMLLASVTVIALCLPLLSVWLLGRTALRSA